MISFEPAALEPLRAFRRVLDAYDYDVLLRTLRGLYYFFDPALGDDSFRIFHELRPLPDECRTLFELLLLGQAVDPGRAQRVFGQTLTAELLDLGLLRESEGALKTDLYAVVAQDGQYFIVTYTDPYGINPRRSFNVYVGRDSYKLLHHLDRSRRNVRALDLCSGSGILGQALTPWATSVTGVEICDEAVQVSQANAVINGLDESWEVCQGDLWKPVEGRRFDLVLSNPPFVAVPLSVPFPAFGWGGDDGLLFLKRIFQDLDKHLEEAGRAQVIFEAIGSATEPIVLPLLSDLSAEHPHWSIKVLLYNRVLLSAQSMHSFGEAVMHMAGTPDRDSAERITLDVVLKLHEQGFRYTYMVLVLVDSAPVGATGLRVYPLYNPWDEHSVPSFKRPVGFSEQRCDMLHSPLGISLGMDPEDRLLIEGFDGTASLGQASRQASEIGLPPDSLLSRGLDLCRVLHQRDFLRNPAGHWDQVADTQNPFIPADDEEG